MDTFTDHNEHVFEAIVKAIREAFSSKMHGIGNVIADEASALALVKKIKDRGDFWDAITYNITEKPDSMTLGVGSPVKHEPYVLGGKVPSWTPLEPLMGWVERKNLAWVDKKTKNPLTIEQMARMIQFSIKRKGIEPRNVFAEVLKNKQEWIFDQLNSVNLVLN